jgi:hypothetical protein
MLYSAKMRTEGGTPSRKNLTAKDFNDARTKAQQLTDALPYKAELIDVFLVGSKEDKQGFHDAE